MEHLERACFFTQGGKCCLTYFLGMLPELTEGEREQYSLLEQLVAEKIRPADFIVQWVRVGFSHSSDNLKEESPIPPVTPKPKIVVTSPAQSSRLTPQQGDTMIDEITGMEFVFIPEGYFMMGSPPDEEGRYKNEGPVHEVRLNAFWMGKYPVMQSQWESVIGKSSLWQKLLCKNPAKFLGENYPVENISWYDTNVYINKMNKLSGRRYRFPTEAEWEYACRAGSSAERYGELDEVAWYSKNSGRSTHPVGEKQPNAFGLYDMLGNVWEWCNDWYGEDYYASSPKENPTGPSSGAYRIIRGGGYIRNPRVVRSAIRVGNSPDTHGRDLGFRLALPVQQGR